MPDEHEEDTMTPEQRYRIELAKDRTPSTNHFVWVVPAFLLACWMCGTDGGQETARRAGAYAVKESPALRASAVADFSKYPNGDPVCQGDSWCFLGWRL